MYVLAIMNFVADRRQFDDCARFSKQVFDLCDDADVDLICMAGWLCLLDIPAAYHDRVMNIHPALLPSFGGKGMYGRRVHQAVFDSEGPLHDPARSLYEKIDAAPALAGRAAHLLEQAAKVPMFKCRDCGDCSLPDIAYVCPESICAKNQRNGPCGGTRDGKCEVFDFECIWSRAYDRAKSESKEQELLAHAPVIQDESLRCTSSWANSLLGRDHTAHGPRHSSEVKSDVPPTAVPGPDARSNARTCQAESAAV